jgi:LPXTG-motif cell wall-anchored protein
MNRRVRAALVSFGVVAIPVALASAAFACQSLSTLQLSAKSGPSGSTVTATGGNWSAAASSSNVDIHLDTRTGPVLASTKPATGSSTISTPVTISASTGYHVLIATQSANGVPRAGTPGRASYQVTAGPAAASATTLPSGLASPLTLAGLVLMSLVGFLARRRRHAVTA